MLYKLCKGWDSSSLLSDGNRSTCLGAGQLCSPVGHSRTGIPCQRELPSLPMPPTEHQQIRGRHGCNWKLENAALWYEAPLRELQEGIGEKKPKERSGVVARAANHSAREPWRALGQPSVTCLTHPVARLPRRRCTWLAHTGCHSALGNLCWTREKKSSCQKGAAGAGWGELSSVGKGFFPPQDGIAVQSWQ